MLSADAHTTGKQDMTQLHAATCLMMIHFINGRHCPKLAHVIVQQLQKLLSHPVTQEIPGSRDMYLQLLEHWQTVLSWLLEQKQASRPSHLYH
jgi:hypothetical protein